MTTYRDAGVDIDAGDDLVRRIRPIVKETFTPGVLTDIGAFGAFFELDLAAYRRPVLVSSVDGVGTKLKVAHVLDRHDTIGQDLVNHCVNDIAVCGADPLFFLDYFATGKLLPEVGEAIVRGFAVACKENGCALVGGETAEMPGFYSDGEYDLAGFVVGIVDKSRVIDGKSIRAGDVVLGLPSTGLHTNGYSLARKLFFEIGNYGVNDVVPELDGATVGEALLTPHRSYLQELTGLLDKDVVKGLAHITGGGLLENIPRILPENAAVEINRGTWDELPVFGVMKALGNVEDNEMFRTFNMGIGMVIVCSEADKSKILSHMEGQDERCFEIGRIVEGGKNVRLV